jgi:hypothetical protein
MRSNSSCEVKRGEGGCRITPRKIGARAQGDLSVVRRSGAANFDERLHRRSAAGFALDCWRTAFIAGTNLGGQKSFDAPQLAPRGRKQNQRWITSDAIFLVERDVGGAFFGVDFRQNPVAAFVDESCAFESGFIELMAARTPRRSEIEQNRTLGAFA